MNCLISRRESSLTLIQSLQKAHARVKIVCLSCTGSFWREMCTFSRSSRHQIENFVTASFGCWNVQKAATARGRNNKTTFHLYQWIYLSEIAPNPGWDEQWIYSAWTGKKRVQNFQSHLVTHCFESYILRPRMEPSGVFEWASNSCQF